MKALVLWCRWHNASLRLMGRDAEAVWGELRFGEDHQPFRYALQSRRLTIGAGESRRALHLDEMGVELSRPDSAS